MDSVAGGAGPPHDPAMQARIAVLEEIAASTKEALLDLWQELRALRTETSRRDEAVRDAQERDFRILFAALMSVAIGLAAMMAKGFHWF